jgi:hypothetical protein
LKEENRYVRRKWQEMHCVYGREKTPPMTSTRRAHGATREDRSGVAVAAQVDGGDVFVRAGQGLPEGRDVDPFDAPIQPPRPTTGGLILSVRVSREEAQVFDAVIRAAGFSSRSEALRSLVRGAGGAVAPLPEEVDLLAVLARALHKIGVNVNQIALAANRRQIALMRAEWDEIAALRKLLPELRLGVGRLVARRREVGIATVVAAVGRMKPRKDGGTRDA